MTFIESLLVLLLAAVVLLQVSRRLSLPHPAMLARAGVAVALIPGSPAISFEPDTALALFMAPVVLDAASSATRPRDPLNVEIMAKLTKEGTLIHSRPDLFAEILAIFPDIPYTEPVLLLL